MIAWGGDGMDGETVAARFEFGLLGPLTARRDGEPLPLGGPMQQAVLAALVLRAGQRCGPEELVDALWDENAPPRAVGAIRTYVYRLRQAFGTGRDALSGVSGGYRLDVPRTAVDSHRFEELSRAAEREYAAGHPDRAHGHYAEALALWHGEALAGVAGPLAERERARLTEARTQARTGLLRCMTELGDHARAAADLAALIAEHPLREDLRALRMLALHRSGRAADALAEYARARETLVAELGVEPGPELAEAHRQVLAAPPAAAGDGPARPPVPARPCQLPPAPADLTGRHALRAELARALRPMAATVPLVVLSGIGGVGKTSLALDAAHRARADYPDGQLYVDLRGADGEPADPYGVLSDFLLALGTHPAAIPASLQGRTAAFRTLLAERRMLVLLDNAAHLGQLTPLLPGAPGSAALITSRSRVIAPAGARRIEVPLPEETEAVAMLARFAGTERVAEEPLDAAELVRSCGLLPLALRIVGARLTARPGRSLGAMVARLRDQGRKLAELRAGDLSVEATLILGYEALTPDQARALRLCALLDCADFPTEVAAALLGCSEEEADDLLELLTDAGLLESHGVNRFRFHDLVRLSARRRAHEEDGAEACAAALLRVADFLLATLLEALRVTDEDAATAVIRVSRAERRGLAFAGAPQARAWLLAEHRVLTSTLERVLLDVPSGLPTAVDAITLLGVSGLFDGPAHQRDVERAADQAVAAAERAGDLGYEARGRDIRAWLAYLRGDLAAAEPDLVRAAHCAAQAGPEFEVNIHVSHSLLSMVLADLGREDEAAMAYLRARYWAGDPEDGSSPGRFMEKLGRLHSLLHSAAAEDNPVEHRRQVVSRLLERLGLQGAGGPVSGAVGSMARP